MGSQAAQMIFAVRGVAQEPPHEIVVWGLLLTTVQVAIAQIDNAWRRVEDSIGRWHVEAMAWPALGTAILRTRQSPLCHRR